MHENLQLACKQSQNFLNFRLHCREFSRSLDQGSHSASKNRLDALEFNGESITSE